MSKIRIRSLLDNIIQLTGDNEIKKDIVAGHLQTLYYQLTDKLPISYESNFFPNQNNNKNNFY